MMNLYMKRAYLPGRIGTFAVLFDATGRELARTVEPAWTNNRLSVSCIPEGQYTITKHHSPSKGWCFKIENPALAVDENPPTGKAHRTYILMHEGVIADHSEGCVIVGRRFITYKGKWGVSNSSETMMELLEELGEGTHKLNISVMTAPDLYCLAESNGWTE